MIKTVLKAFGIAIAALTASIALPNAANAAAGLNGAYYSFGATSPNTISNTLALISAASGPTATFTATAVCFPNCTGGQVNDQSASLSSFLGGNATGLTNNPSYLGNDAIDLTGFITIDTAGSHSFMLSSDDGSALWIDGVQIVNNDGIHPIQSASGSVNLTAGLHTIRIVQFENGGGTALAGFMDGNALNSSILSTASAVPEPASWTMMIGGFGLIGGALRSRRRLATA